VTGRLQKVAFSIILCILDALQLTEANINRNYSKGGAAATLVPLLAILLIVWNVVLTWLTASYSSPQVETLFFHVTVSGILYFITAVTFIQYLLLKEKTYILYVVYVLINLCYFTFIYSSHPFITVHFPKWFAELRYFLSIPLLTASYCVYVLFAMSFLSVRSKDKVLYKWLSLFSKVYFGILLVSLLLFVFPTGHWFANLVRTILLLSSMPLGIVSIALVYIRLKNNIARILCIGSLCFFTGSVLGFLFSSNLLPYPVDAAPFNQWVFYTETGALIEIVLFSSSFAYRNKFLEQEERKAQEVLLMEMEENKLKEQKLKAIRNEIARDLHDDIGATLSNINILNELAKRNASNPSVAKEYLDKAGEDIQYVSESLNDIVWNINPKYDELENLFIRMRRYASDMMDGKNIHYEIILPSAINDLQLNMDKRRDLYLLFKEAVNNLVKYSKAKSANITLTVEGSVLRLSIKDDGIGFEAEKMNAGNGLVNMQQRATQLQAQLTIKSSPEKGTAVLLEMPL
jgi:signal transduction histidine kinase